MEAAIGAPHRFWAFRRNPRGGIGDELVMAPADSLAVMRTTTPAAPGGVAPRISPNGRLLAYTSSESGRQEIYVHPLPGPGPRIMVSINGGVEPMWAPEGVLYFRSNGRMMSATIAESPALAVTKRDSLWVDIYEQDASHPDYDVGRNGRFLMTQDASLRREQVGVIVHWPALKSQLRESRPDR